MGFNTELRRARDQSQPINRRLSSLSHAIEKFGLLGFRWTFRQLYTATGSSPGEWTSSQIGAAVELLAHAHQSWIEYLHGAELESRAAKRKPGYARSHQRELFEQWRAIYFDADKRGQWHI